MRRKLAILAVVLAALLLVAEITLRLVGLGDPPLAVLDPDLEYRLVPNARYTRWGNRIEVNSHGFRAPDHTPLPGTNEARVLLIGDSIVYGNHFLDQDETIALRLSDLFAAKGCDLRAIPMALSSWGPVNQAAALDRYGSFGASHAAIVLSAHDLSDVPEQGTDLLPYRLAPPIGAIGDLAEAVLERLRPAMPEPGAAVLSYDTRVDMSLAALDRMADRLEREGIAPLLVYNATESERAGVMRPERAVFLEWADARGLDVLDLTEDPLVSLDDHIHPDALGAARIAARLRDWLAPRVPCGAG